MILNNYGESNFGNLWITCEGEITYTTEMTNQY